MLETTAGRRAVPRGGIAVYLLVVGDLTVQIDNAHATYPRLSTGTLALIVVCQVLSAGVALAFCRARLQERRPARWQLLLAADIVLVGLVPAWRGLYWGSLPAFALVACMLVSARRSWPLIVGLEVSTLVVGVASARSVESIVYWLNANVLLALSVWALTQVVLTADTLRATRRRAAGLALAEERGRLSRDLHDQLGYSLSAITLEGELAARSVDSDPAGECADRLRSIATVARQAAQEVDALARGGGQLTLVGQLASAREVLETAGVDLRVLGAATELPAEHGAVLATVVREGVTNVLRHSLATRCTVTFTRDAESVVVRLRNDGASRGTGEGPWGGLTSLQVRVRSVGGDLGAEPIGAADYELCARIPVNAR